MTQSQMTQSQSSQTHAAQTRAPQNHAPQYPPSQYHPPNPRPTAPATRLPPNTCDSLFLVVAPAYRSPVRPGAAYEMPSATIETALGLHRLLGIERGVIVQATTYGADHQVVLDGLAGAAVETESSRCLLSLPSNERCGARLAEISAIDPAALGLMALNQRARSGTQ